MTKLPPRILLSLPLILATLACADPGDVEIGETRSELLVSSWSAPALAHEAFRGGAMATVNGTTFMVTSGECGSFWCGGADEGYDLYWSKLTATGWTSLEYIEGQRSSRRVSLAAFNGSLYMVRVGEEEDATDLWISRFDPSSETWSESFLIPYTSFNGAPAIAEFQGQLWFVGTTSGNFQMWAGTMSAGEIFTTSKLLPDHFSASRPSAAVFQSVLYVAHRHGQTGDIVIFTLDGKAVSADRHILAGPLGAPIRGLDPTLASVNGFLHLVHTPPTAENVMWTYFDGCKWPAEVSIGRLTSSTFPVLTAGGPGLLLATTIDDTWNTVIETRDIFVSRFTAPRAPITGPIGCLVVTQ